MVTILLTFVIHPLPPACLTDVPDIFFFSHIILIYFCGIIIIATSKSNVWISTLGEMWVNSEAFHKAN